MSLLIANMYWSYILIVSLKCYEQYTILHQLNVGTPGDLSFSNNHMCNHVEPPGDLSFSNNHMCNHVEPPGDLNFLKSYIWTVMYARIKFGISQILSYLWLAYFLFCITHKNNIIFNHLHDMFHFNWVSSFYSPMREGGKCFNYYKYCIMYILRFILSVFEFSDVRSSIHKDSFWQSMM